MPVASVRSSRRRRHRRRRRRSATRNRARSAASPRSGGRAAPRGTLSPPRSPAPAPRETEVLLVPLGLAGDRLDDVGVDLGQRVVAGNPAEHIRQLRVAAGVVQRMARLVEERLIVVEAALGACDQVHDLRWVARDHAGARRLLRPIVEVELDVRSCGEVEPERVERRRQISVARSFV